MHIARVTLKSTEGSPYQSGNFFTSPKNDLETPDAYEERVWRERGHYDENGRMFIPGVAFKFALAQAAGYNPRKLKGSSTYAKLFESSVLVTDNLPLNVTKDEVEGVPVMANSKGEKSGSTRGAAKRVKKFFPTVRSWSGKLDFYVMDDRISEQVFTDTLRDTGLFGGVGVWRPSRGGMHGRFTVEKVEWLKTG